MSKVKRNAKKTHIKDGFEEKNKKWMEPSTTYTKELFPDSSAISKKTKQTIRPVIKDHYGPETERY